jgi:HK97 family phage prohead protease
MADFETRTVAATFEMRDDPQTGGPILEGYATTFNDPYDMGAFREQIHPKAFDKTLRTDKTTGLIAADVRLLIDHEGQPLARTKSGTLTLTPDSTGLHARAILDPSDPSRSVSLTRVTCGKTTTRCGPSLRRTCLVVTFPW